MDGAVNWAVTQRAKARPGAALVVMAALRSGCGHYIFVFFLSSFFFYICSSPNLSGRRVDVYHTSTHGVALVQI